MKITEKRKEIERKWEFETKRIKIPTVAEVAKKEWLSWQEAAEKCIIICGNIHKDNDIDCFRKLKGHTLCNGCPKYYLEEKRQKTFFEWEKFKATKSGN